MLGSLEGTFLVVQRRTRDYFWQTGKAFGCKGVKNMVLMMIWEDLGHSSSAKGP